MDHKIREDFGNEAVPDPVRKRRRFWSRGHGAKDEGDEVPMFVIVEVAVDFEAWPAGRCCHLCCLVVKMVRREDENGAGVEPTRSTRIPCGTRQCSALEVLAVGQARVQPWAACLAGRKVCLSGGYNEI
jgi:hypothetical protein